MNYWNKKNSFCLTYINFIKLFLKITGLFQKKFTSTILTFFGTINYNNFDGFSYPLLLHINYLNKIITLRISVYLDITVHNQEYAAYSRPGSESGAAAHLGGGGRQVRSFNRCGLRGYAADHPTSPIPPPSMPSTEIVGVGVGAEDSDVATARQHDANYTHRTLISGGE